MSTELNDKQSWLAQAHFDGSINWSKACVTNAPYLFDRVTLHDSEWEAVTMERYNTLVLAFRLDAFWNSAYTQKPQLSEWPCLVIRFEEVLNISYSKGNYSTTISYAESKRLATSDIQKMETVFKDNPFMPADFYNRLIACKELYKTIIADLQGDMEILHDGGIDILLIDIDGTYLDPSLTRLPPFEPLPENEKNNTGFISWLLSLFKKK